MWQFGPYRMEELIARGGMGEVHRAYDTQHDRMVAVKVVGGHVVDDDDFRRRFSREARAAASLREPHVIPIHAYGEIDGRLYLDMRLVEGADLSSVLAEHGPMSPAAAVDVISQVASALDAAHAEGLVHRDVKPSNVLLGAGGFAYLIDFGLARSLAANADITQTGIPIGTVAYMAPERFAPDGGIDHRVDVYSLACLLFQCLTGSLPFTRGNALALMHAHINEEPPRPSAHGLSPVFDHVIAAGMAKRPEDRFQSAGALASAARFALTQPLPAQPATLPAPNRRPPAPRRGRWWLVGAAAVVAGALVGAAALIWPMGTRGGGATDQPTTTPSSTDTADLRVSIPISKPACDGTYIVIVGSAVEPQEYKSKVQEHLDAHAGTHYLHAPSTGCNSLRHHYDDGADIYSVYYGPFADKDTACARRASVGGDSFVRRLDETSTPARAVSCE